MDNILFLVGQLSWLVLPIVVLALTVIVFRLIRELVLWYFGINKIIDNQEEIIKQLRLIAGQTRYKPPTP